jgi:serine-type D-Ala-D-Ala carboxypeptidase/endopeptidase (penicillin-binding protein 4)
MNARTLQASGRIHVIFALFFTAATLGASSVFAQTDHKPVSQEKLTGQLGDLVRDAALGDKLGVVILEIGSGKVIYTHNPDLPLNPASNQKLLTAASALWELGPGFTMRTGVYGEIQDNAIVGGAFLKGYGDPELRWLDLVDLAQQVALAGIKSVDEVIVDGSYFDNQSLPPAYDQHPEEIASFRAPIGAIAVDRSTYVISIRPAPENGLPALVQLSAPGYFELDNGLITSASGQPEVMASQNAKGDKVQLVLRGRVPMGIKEVSYRRCVDNPLLYGGYAFIEALRSQRVQVPIRVELRSMPDTKPLVASVRSQPLATLIGAMGKNSDNFVAEMVLKVIGAERKKVPGRSSDGASVVLNTLKRIGINTGKIAVINGSGLYDGNLVNTGAIAKLLATAYLDPAISAEFIAHLAIAGADGTLMKRLTDLPASRIVRAKTGTLSDAVSLSGYVLAPSPERAIAFSYIANHIASNPAGAKKLADDLVRAIARYLWQ